MSAWRLAHVFVVAAARSPARCSLQWQQAQLSAPRLLDANKPTSATHLRSQSLALSSRSHSLFSCPVNARAPGHCHSQVVRTLRTNSLPDQPVESQPGIKAAVPKPSLNTTKRISGYLRESLLLSYTALFDNVIFRAFELLRLDRILKWLTPHLEDGYAKVTGNWYQLADGRRRSISLVNHTAFDFSIPPQYKAADFPFNSTAELSIPAYYGSSNNPSKPGLASSTQLNAAKQAARPSSFDTAGLHRAHMLSLCMKLVYEKRGVIDDIAATSFGCTLHGYFLTNDKQTQKRRETSTDAASKHSKAGFVPRTLAITLDLPKAKIVAFRGTEPTNLINMRSSGSIGMTHPKGMGGVHDGFWTALMYESEEEGGVNLFDRLVGALQEGDSKQDIYLTGHSLGGALAAVFAQALHAKGHTELARRVKGVYTFGGPRIGDAEFCRLLSGNYPEANFRYVHGADIIPKIPPRFLLYDHFPTEIFLSSFGDLVLDSHLISRWHTIESYGYLPIQLLKTFGNLIRLRESPIRTLYRLALLVTVPGLSDHFPQDYEQLLRDQVVKAAGRRTPIIQKWSKFSRIEYIVTSE